MDGEDMVCLHCDKRLKKECKKECIVEHIELTCAQKRVSLHTAILHHTLLILLLIQKLELLHPEFFQLSQSGLVNLGALEGVS